MQKAHPFAEFGPAAVKHISDPEVIPEMIIKVVPFDAAAVAFARKLKPTAAQEVRSVRTNIAETHRRNEPLLALRRLHPHLGNEWLPNFSGFRSLTKMKNLNPKPRSPLFNRAAVGIITKRIETRTLRQSTAHKLEHAQTNSGDGAAAAFPTPAQASVTSAFSITTRPSQCLKPHDHATRRA